MYMYIGSQSIAKLPNCQSLYIEGKYRHHDFTSRDTSIEHPKIEAFECRQYLGWQITSRLFAIWSDRLTCFLDKIYITCMYYLWKAVVFRMESWVWALCRSQFIHINKNVFNLNKSPSLLKSSTKRVKFLAPKIRGSGPKS